MDKKMRVLGLLFLGLFLLPILSSFVAAAPTDIFDPVKDMFINWEKGQLSVNVAKYLFAILITLLVYGVLEFVPIIKSQAKGLKFLIAVIVGFLGTAYLAPSSIYTTLTSYGAMAVVMGGVLPLLILLFFSIEISKEGGVGGKLISNLVWIAYIIYLVWKIIAGMFFCTLVSGVPRISFTSIGGACINFYEGAAYVVLVVVAVIWIISSKKLRDLLFKAEAKQEAENVVKSLKMDKIRYFERRLNQLNEDLAVAEKTKPRDPAKITTIRNEIDAVEKELENIK